MISPWNLLVGGLLIKNLSFLAALTSIVIGYAILTFIFVVYGGLGLRRREQSGVILGELFGSHIGNYLVPTVLALGQIGWASINIMLGGASLAKLVHIPHALGLIVFALVVGVIASLGLTKIGIIKWIITVSALGLLVLIFVNATDSATIDLLKTHQIAHKHSIFWGVSAVVASLISFSSVSPDFFCQVRDKKDVTISSILGIFFPGILIVLAGCILFVGKDNSDLVVILAALSLPSLAQIFNAITNTSGSTALYTPALKLQGMFKMSVPTGVAIGGAIALALALAGLGDRLEIWLKFLSIFSPALVGCALASWATRQRNTKRDLVAFIVAVIGATLLSPFVPAVFVSLALPFAVIGVAKLGRAG